MSELVWVGYCAAFLTITALIPQVIRSFRTRKTRDLSLLMALILASGLTLWLVYGFVVNDLVIIFANSIQAPLAWLLVLLKLRYG